MAAVVGSWLRGASGGSDADVGGLLTVETAPCHFEAEEVIVFNADERLEEIRRLE